MILEKNYILNNLKDKYFNDNGNIKVFRFKKGDIAYIYDNFDIIKRIRNIDYFVNTDGQYYQCIRSGYLTINHNGDLSFLKTRNRNGYTYIDFNGKCILNLKQLKKYYIKNKLEFIDGIENNNNIINFSKSFGNYINKNLF